jgi:hypothetical protein
MALTHERPVWTASFTTTDTEEPQRFTEEFSVYLCVISVSAVVKKPGLPGLSCPSISILIFALRNMSSLFFCRKIENGEGEQGTVPTEIPVAPKNTRCARRKSQQDGYSVLC